MDEKDHAESMSEKDAGRELSTSSHPNENDLNGTEQRVKKDVDLENGERVEREGSVDSYQKIPWTFTRCVAIAALCGSYVGTLYTHFDRMKFNFRTACLRKIVYKVPDRSIFHWWRLDIHRARPHSRAPTVAAQCQSPRDRSNPSIRWVLH